MKNKINPLFLDKNGFIHTDENPSLSQSENKLMFTALCSIFYHVDPILDEVYLENKFRRNAHRDWNNGSFSHDEMTGLYCLLNDIQDLPIIKWEGEYWLHPRDIAFYLYCHFKVLGLIFLPVVTLSMIVSCLQDYKYRNGKRFLRTDGKLLTYLRCKKYNLKMTFWICDKIIKNKKLFGSWDRVFSIYFKNPSHPLNTIKGK